MATEDDDLEVPLSELGLASVKDHSDARGWPVLAANGVQTGQVADLLVDTRTGAPHAYVVEIGGDSGLGSAKYRVLVSAERARVDSGSRRIHLDTLSWTDVALLPRYGEAPPPPPRDDDTVIVEPSAPVSDAVTKDVRMTLFAEEMKVGKRTVRAGDAVIRKRTETEQVREVVPVMREEVVIERRPVPEGVGFEPRVEGDVTYIPLVQEELVVEKRLVAREELVVRKRQVVEEQVVEETLRRDEIEVTREDPRTERA